MNICENIDEPFGDAFHFTNEELPTNKAYFYGSVSCFTRQLHL